jgi:hypothetical protein
VVDSRNFIDIIKHSVRDAVVSGTLRILQRPPGRRPSAELTENSLWYEAQRARLSSVIQFAVDQAVFGFLYVIDGVRVIENAESKGRLELRYIREKTTVLNPPDGPMLHDMY